VELSGRDSPPVAPLWPSLVSFACLVAVWAWGGGNRAVAVAATWWCEPGLAPAGGELRLTLATGLLALGAAFAVLGVVLGVRAARAGAEGPWVRVAIRLPFVLLLAMACCILMGRLEMRWPGAEGQPMFGLDP
jgi:hypothetical protein